MMTHALRPGPPPACAADEMIPAQPPRPLDAPVDLLQPTIETSGTMPAGLRLLSDAAASMPSTVDLAGEPGQQAPHLLVRDMPATVPPGLIFNSVIQTQSNLDAGVSPPGTIWNSDLGVAFTALWAAGFQAGQQMADSAPGALGASCTLGTAGSAPSSVPVVLPGAVPEQRNASEIEYHQVRFRKMARARELPCGH
jgi:hypothetical protein